MTAENPKSKIQNRVPVTGESKIERLSEAVMLRHDGLFWSFIAINVVGFVWGTIGWYGQQLPRTPLMWWLFVPDCPLVAGLAAIALWGLRQGKKWTVFNLWTAMGCIKYGVWTCMIWLAYWLQTSDFFFLSVAMFVTHIGLIAQGVVLLILTGRWSVRDVLPAFAYYIFADFVDYRLGHHPLYPFEVSAALVQWHTVSMTWLLGMLLIALAKVAGDRPAPASPTPIYARESET
ncbi:MAG: DUF1405 domain-containing protein [Ardenticatenaceae bacterium]